MHDKLMTYGLIFLGLFIVGGVVGSIFSFWIDVFKAIF